jgi:hypothetical protein
MSNFEQGDADDRRRALKAEQRKRWLYLQFLYDVAHNARAGQRETVEPDVIAYTLGLSAEERSRIEEYFENQGLIEYLGFGPTVAISQAGIEAVERALKEPSQSTAHFPPVTNVLNVTGGIHGSMIQQGTSASHQSMTLRGSDRDALTALAREIRAAVEVTIPPAAVQTAAIVDVDTIEKQLESPAPRVSVLRDVLLSLRSVLEQSGSGVIASKIVAFLEQAGWM